MAKASAEIREAVEPHVADGESLRIARIDEDEDHLIAVTDRRVIEVERSKSGTTLETEVESYLLSDDRITGVTYERQQIMDVPLWIGPVIMLGGLILLPISFVAGPLAPIVALITVLTVFVGLAVTFVTLLDESSGTEVTIRSTAQGASWSLPEQNADVARTISQVVAEQNP